MRCLFFIAVFSLFNQLVSQDIKIFNDSNSIIHKLDSLNTNYYYQLKGCVKFDEFLSTENLNLVERLLMDSVRGYNSINLNLILDRQILLEEYFFEIISAKSESGKHIVWVTGSCRKDERWGEKFLGHANDGGHCYFNVVINVSDNKIILFRVNGF